MSKITLNIPEVLTDLPKKELALLMGHTLRNAVESRIVQIEEEIREGQGYLEQYEKKYGLSFEAYEQKIDDLEFVGSIIKKTITIGISGWSACNAPKLF